MNAIIAGVLACVLYLVGAGLQFSGIGHQNAGRKNLVIGAGILAVLVHGVFTWQDIFTSGGVDMGIFPMASLISLAMAAIIILSSLRRPVENLLIVLFPMAAVCISLSLFAPDAYTPRTTVPGGIGIHIVLSVIAYSMLTVAAFQAVLLSFGDYELRNRRLGILKNMPPLQTMEGLLFELIWAGLVFLSLSIITGFVFIGMTDSSIPGLIHHAVITFSAWVVFTVLLWGRYNKGWRGAIASRWTLSGFALLVLGYFGSKFVIEMVLGRA